MPSDSGIPFYSSFVGGLSDPSTTQYKHRRAVFDLVNKLHSDGLEHQLDLPQIAVVGSQSVGKSSLIESIAGIKLPRAQGTCTRCPIECHLSRSNSSWSCEVYLRLANQEEVPFGQRITDSDEVEERIRRAQLAILNPKTKASDFLGTPGSTNAGLTNELSFSSDLISVRISGIEVDDLSFVDLPGVISSVKDGGRDKDIDEVKNLVLKAIEKPSCLILLVVTGETDLENQAGRHLVKKVDPTGSRTIPVLTKPDRIESGQHDEWLRLLKDEEGHFQHGWFCVKQPNQQQLDSGISWQDARDYEENFFAATNPWRIQATLKSRLGTQFLTSALGKKLFDLICNRLPDLIREVESRVGSLTNEIKRLPIKSMEDPLRMILKLTTDFKTDVEQLVKGRPGAGKTGLVQTFRKSKEQFSTAISRQAPEFKPYDRPDHPLGDLQTQPFEWSNVLDESRMSLSPTGTSKLLDITGEEEWETSGVEDPSTFVYLDEVLDVAKYAITRELPYNYPYAVKEHYVTRFTRKWPLPARKLFHNVELHFSMELDALVLKHFSRFAPGGLDDAVLRTVEAQLKKCRTRTHQKIQECVALEQEEPATVDEDSLALHKAEFSKRYTAARQTHLKKTSNIQNFLNGSYDNSPMPHVFQYLQQMGIENVKKEDLLRLLPVAMGDATAIDIMSEVRAYYQVAYKRFVDYIPMIIDFELLKGFNRSLDDALYHGLGLGEGDTRQRCASFLREDTAVVRLRSMLHRDLERFEAALSALRGISSLSSHATYRTVAPNAEVAEETEELPATPLRRMSSPEEIGIPARSRSSTSGEMVAPASSYVAVPPRSEGGGKKKKGKGKMKR